MVPISVTLSATDYQTPTVRASFKNQSPDKCYEVANYPLKPNRDSFQITNKLTGEDAIYTGPMIKLKPYYIPMQPGEIKEVEIQLGEWYEMSEGQYSVKYISNLPYRNCGDGSEMYNGFAESNTIDVKV